MAYRPKQIGTTSPTFEVGLNLAQLRSETTFPGALYVENTVTPSASSTLHISPLSNGGELRMGGVGGTEPEGILQYNGGSFDMLASYGSGIISGGNIGLVAGGSDTTAGSITLLAGTGSTTNGSIVLQTAFPFELEFRGTDGALLIDGDAGTAGQVLTSNGTAPPTWETVSSGSGTVTSVAMTVPSFLSVSGSPITTSGTLAVTLSGTALPVANGGTGLTSPGTTGNVLTSNGTAWVSSAPAGGGSVYYKDAVRVATTAAGTLASSFANGQVVDGVTLATGDRILIKNQSTASENGIYTVNASGAPTRATDFDTTGAEVSNGVIVPVQFGTVNGGSTWQLVQNGGTIGNSFRFAPLNGILGAGQATWTTPSATGTNSIAIGNGATTSTATDAIAIGRTATAVGNESVSIGYLSTTNVGTRNVAIGYGAQIAANSSNQVAIGDAIINGSATGPCVAIGSEVRVLSGTAGHRVLIGRRAQGREHCVVVGGNAASTACNAWGVALGTDAYARGDYAVSVGPGTDTNVANGIAIGRNANNLGQLGSIAFGYNSTSYMPSELAIATGNFSAAGDAQVSLAKYWMQTTNATPTELGGGANSTTPTGRVILSNDTSYIFDCDIIARNTATDTETAGFNLKFVIRRGTNAASTTIVGTPVKTILAQDTGTTTWDVNVTADTTNGRPNISVTGEASKTIRWVCNMNITRVTG